MQLSPCRRIGAMVLLALASACSDENLFESATQRLAVPVIGDRAAVRDSIALEAPRPLCATGAAFTAGAYDFVLEGREGYHVLPHDTLAPGAPVAFLRVPGTSYLGAVGPVLVVDSYSDLLRLRVDVAGASVTVAGELLNGLAPTNGFPVEDSELVVGFEVMGVPVRQDADGTVLAAWRCATCYEPIDGDGASVQPGVVTIVTSDRFSSVALLGLDAYVGDGLRLRRYQSVGETFVKTGERVVGEPVGRMTAVPAGVIAQVGAEQILISGEQLSPTRFSVSANSCDLSAASEGLLVVARDAGASCGSKLANRIHVLDRSATAPTLPVLGEISLPNATALAISGDVIYVATEDAIHVYGREVTQAGDYTPRKVQTIAAEGLVNRLTVLASDTRETTLVADVADGLLEYTIAPGGELALRRTSERAAGCR